MAYSLDAKIEDGIFIIGINLKCVINIKEFFGFDMSKSCCGQNISVSSRIALPWIYYDV
jgi:hypothetical protein